MFPLAVLDRELIPCSHTFKMMVPLLIVAHYRSS